MEGEVEGMTEAYAGDTYTNRVFSSKIETLNGHFVDPLNAAPEDIRIEDIAHALSLANRFSGYTSRPYSVAEHSVYVARLVAMRIEAAGGGLIDGAGRFRDTKAMVRQALLHDATEAYLIDMPSPIKREFPNYRAAEKRLWAVIAARFDVPVEMHSFVKEADGRLLTTEKLALLGPATPENEWGAYFRDYPPYSGAHDIIDRYDVSWRSVRRRFLDFWQNVKPLDV